MSALAEKYRERGLVVLAVNSWDEDVATLRGFVENDKLAQRVLVNGGEVAGEYGVTSVPTNVFVDPNGIVVDAEVGFEGPAPLERRIVRLIDKPR